MARIDSRLAGASIATLLLAACGGGGGAQAVRDARPPSVQVAFPAAFSCTGATTIAVSGSCSDPDGVLAVSVAGIAAASSDGFATWSTRVPLVAGRQELVIDVVDGGGRRTRRAARLVVQQEPTLSDPAIALLDVARDRLVILDLSERSITAVARDGGGHVPLSDAAHGSGPFGNPRTMALDPPRDRLIAIDGATLLAIALASGDRAIVSGGGVGAGPAIATAVAVAVDADRQRAFVAHQPGGTFELLEVDLANGNRTIVSGPTKGSGPTFFVPRGLALLPLGATALVSDVLDDAIYAIDTATGARSLLSGSARGSGPAFSTPAAIAASSDGSVAWVVDRLGIVQVNPVTGDRAIVADATHGSGPSTEALSGLSLLDEAAGTLLVAAPVLATVLEVDVATGDREDALDDLFGGGPSFEFCFDVAVDLAGGRALVAASAGGVVEVDLATGARSTLSGAARGSGPALDFASSVDFDLITQRAIVHDGFDGTVLAVDLASGDRTLLSGDGAGSGPDFSSMADLAVDPDRRLAFVADGHFVASDIVGRILAVDLATGARTIVTDETRGTGPFFENDVQVAVDSERNRVLVVDNDSEQLFAVDLATGNRTVISGPSDGAGPLWNGPRGIGLSLDGDRAFVVDFVSGGNDLYEVDVLTGRRALVLALGEGSGPVVRNFRALAALDDGGRLLGADHVTNALLLVDVASGDRVIASQ